MSNTNLKWDILAKVMRRLDQMGFTYKVHKRMSVSTRVAGYKVLIVDIVVLDKNEVPMIALFLGPKKQRRILKYKMLRIPVFYFHTNDIENEFEKMVAEYANRLT